MVSSDSGPDQDPIDPVYAALFRPDTPRPEADPEVEPEQMFEAEAMFEPIVDPVVDPRVELAEAESEVHPPGAVASNAPAIVDTGRLFRSQGVRAKSEAILALSSDHFGRLRTLDRRDDDAPDRPRVIPVGGAMSDAGPAHLADGDGTSTATPAQPDDAATSGESRKRGRRRRHASTGDEPGTGHRSREITGGAVYIVVIGVTVLVGFANALLSDGDVGWPTGLALLISSVYAALTVRRRDDIVAIIVPPLAFLVTAMSAGQLLLGSAEGSLLNRAVIVFFTLADNWMWIIGSTAAALVIVLVRRRRS